MTKVKTLNECPVCCSSKMARRKGKCSLRIGESVVTVSGAEYEICLDCGEMVLGREVVQELQAKYYSRRMVGSSRSVR